MPIEFETRIRNQGYDTEDDYPQTAVLIHNGTSADTVVNLLQAGKLPNRYSSVMTDVRVSNWSELNKEQREEWLAACSRTFKPVEHTHNSDVTLGVDTRIEPLDVNPAQYPNGVSVQFSDGCPDVLGATYQTDIINDGKIPELAFTNDEINSGVDQIRLDYDNLVDGGKASFLESLLELRDIRRLASLATIHSSIITQFASTLLGVNFGLNPLYQDYLAVQNHIDEFDALIDDWNSKVGSVQSKHATFKVQNESFSEEVDLPFSYGYGYRGTAETTALGIGKVHIYYKPKHISPSQKMRIRINALGFDNPIGTAWELVPFSWLIDYFTNIGDMIDAATRSNGLFHAEVLDLGYSFKTELATVFKPYFYTPVVYGGREHALSERVFQSKSYKREALPIATHYDNVQIPRFAFDYSLSGAQTANAVAATWLLTRR